MKPIPMFFCLITRSDPDLYVESNRFDQITICANAVALLTVGVVSAIAWSVFWGSFISAWKALLLGFLCALIIAQVEAAMGAWDWELAGVLRTGRHSADYWFRLALRALIALLLAQATAVGVTLVLCSDTIKDHIQNQRARQNAVIEKEYATRKNEIKSRMIASIEEELEATRETRSRALETLPVLQAQRNEAQEKVDAAYIEMGREEHGLRRPEGRGPRYDDARRHREVAEGLKARLTDEIKRVQASNKALDAHIEKLSEQVISRNRELQTHWQRLDDQKVRDPRWLPERDDPLLRWIALQDIKQHAVYGSEVQRFDLLAKIVLVTFELSFLLIKVVFAPPSVYTVRLLARHKREAAKVSAEYSRAVEEIRRSHPRGHLRIVGGDYDGKPASS